MTPSDQSELRELVAGIRMVERDNMTNSGKNEVIEGMIEDYIAAAEQRAALAALKHLKQYNGAYIDASGKRVEKMVHHSIIDEQIAELEQSLRKEQE